MTVAEVIERLQEMDPRDEVIIGILPNYPKAGERYAVPVIDAYRLKASNGDDEDVMRVVRLGTLVAKTFQRNVVYLDFQREGQA